MIAEQSPDSNVCWSLPCFSLVRSTNTSQHATLGCSSGKTKHSLELHSHLSWPVNPEQCPLDRQDFPGMESMLGVQGGCCDMPPPRLVSGTGIYSFHLCLLLQSYGNLWCFNRISCYYRKIEAFSVEGCSP